MRTEFSNVTVLLFDLKHHTRHQTRVALTGLGFRGIADTHSLEAVPRMLLEARYDLLVGGIDSVDDGVMKLVRRIRRSKCGRDPFVPIILTAWSPSEQLVSGALNAGADDLLVWPFSIRQLGDRVETLSRARKRFVVSENYLGPDRRDDGARPEYFKTIEVPNALRAVVEENDDLRPSEASIEEAMAQLQSEKIRCDARRIEAISQSVVTCIAENRSAKAAELVTDLLQVSTSFRKSIIGSTFAHMVKLADSVNSIAAKIEATRTGVPERELALLEKTAQALRTAADLDNSAVGAAYGISEEIRRAEAPIRAVGS